MTSTPFAVIAGVGTGTGSALARRFAKAYSVILLARNPDNYKSIVNEINSSGGKAIGISADVSDEKSIQNAFREIYNDFGAENLAAAVYNVGGGFFRKPFLQMSLDEFSAGFNSNARGAFIFSQAVLPWLLRSMNPQYPPTLIFTGATASIKANAHVASFAAGKYALRALSQSLAKEFGPKGIHVSHAIIDGVIDIPNTKQWTFGDAPDAKISAEAEHTILQIAEAYWNLHTQPRSAFTFEIDIRPYVEKCSSDKTMLLQSSLVLFQIALAVSLPLLGSESGNNNPINVWQIASRGEDASAVIHRDVYRVVKRGNGLDGELGESLASMQAFLEEPLTDLAIYLSKAETAQIWARWGRECLELMRQRGEVAESQREAQPAAEGDVADPELQQVEAVTTYSSKGQAVPQPLQAIVETARDSLERVRQNVGNVGLSAARALGNVKPGLMAGTWTPGPRLIVP
ncbi:MAG: hypothetical protein M1816_001251 [Peltula sp. TS41687]|nr:MAG: hypothetical protein M1816_001251 [Peltula sp. TS41687]